MPTYDRRQQELADRLKALREQVEPRLSGNALAKRLDWPQSKVSRLENAKQLPSADDIRAWARALSAPAETVEELLHAWERARVERGSWREQYRALGGAAGKQEDILAYEAGATRIAEFQPAMISGLVQTAAYAGELLRMDCGPPAWGTSDDEISRMVVARMGRQQVLYAADKQIQIIMLEAALRCRLVSDDVLAGQLDRLLALVELPSLELGIIPQTARVPVWPISSFVLYDSDVVITESVVDEHWVRDPDEVAAYVRFLDALRDAASHGDAAAAVIRRVLSDLRST